MDEEEEATVVDFRTRGEFLRGGRKGVLRQTTNHQRWSVAAGSMVVEKKILVKELTEHARVHQGSAGSWCNSLGPRTSLLSSPFFFLLFIWLRKVLVAACRIFSCSMWTLSCGMWDLVPKPGIQPRPPALGVGKQPLDCQGSPTQICFEYYFLLPFCHLPNRPPHPTGVVSSSMESFRRVVI